MSILYTNNAATTLSASITSGATSLTVSSGTGTLFPGKLHIKFYHIRAHGNSPLKRGGECFQGDMPRPRDER